MNFAVPIKSLSYYEAKSLLDKLIIDHLSGDELKDLLKDVHLLEARIEAAIEQNYQDTVLEKQELYTNEPTTPHSPDYL